MTNLKQLRFSPLMFAFMVLLISAVLVFNPVFVHASDSVAGDINDDGVVDIIDLEMCFDIIMEVLDPTQLQFQAADVNQDGVIDISDAIIIINLSESLVRPVPGDINNDGVIDMADVNMCLDIIMEVINPTQLQFQTADMNKDRVIDISDVMIIINIVVNPFAGDINNDGVVDIADVMMCVAISLGTLDPTQLQFQTADINKDGVVDNSDVKIISNIIMNS